MRSIGRWAARSLLAAAALVLLLVGLGPLTGAYRLATVLSGSMGPGMPVGSLAVLVPEAPAAVRVGDVITFQAPTPDHPVVTHRVVEIVEGGRHPVLRTKGDANQSPDAWTARLAGDRAWRRVAVIPFAGTAIRLLRSEAFHRLTLQVIPAALVVWMLVGIWQFRPTRSSTVVVALVIMLASAAPAAANFTGTTTASNTIASAADWLPPSVSSTAIAKQTGYLAGSIKQGGIYYVYANVADSGNPASGISTVKTDVSAITSGSTAVSLTAGSYSVNGVSYNYRTGALTAGNPLSGTKNYTITSTDALSHAQMQNGYSVALDNTAPTVTGISTGNAGGGNHGYAELGDTITFTFSEQIDPQSILSGWTGASANVVVELVDGGCTLILCGSDSFKIYDSAYSATLPFGTVDLKDDGYYGCANLAVICSKTPTSFGNTGTHSTMVQSGSSITITLGTQSGGSGSVNDNGVISDMTWSCTNTPYDAAGNTVSASGDTFTETDSDYEF